MSGKAATMPATREVSFEDLRAQLYDALSDLSESAALAEPMPDLAYCYIEETYPDYIIVSCEAAYFKVGYTTDAATGEIALAAREAWTPVEQAWAAKRAPTRSVRVVKSDETTITVAGWGVVFGGVDLYDTRFTKSTDYWLGKLGAKKIVLFDHSFDESVKAEIIGEATITESEEGLWVEAQLAKANRYTARITQLMAKGVLGWSSGSISHLIAGDDDADGVFTYKSWPIIEMSLTPTPAEPRTLGVTQLRSLVASVDGLKALLPQDAPTGEANRSSSASEQGEPTPAATPAAPARVPAEPKKEPTPMELSQLETQVGGLATKMDAISAVLARFDTEPNLKNAGFVSQDGGTADPKIKTMADFLFAIKRQDETRLEKVYGSTKAALSEGGGETGGYTVPLEHAARIAAIAAEDAIVRPRAGLIYPMTSLEVEIPMLDQFTAPSAGQTAFVGGVVASWTEEAATLTETEPKFKLLKLRAHGLGGYTLASNELRADSAEGLDALLTTLFGTAIGWYEDYGFLRGTGVGMPLGALTWAGAISVNRSGGANTFVLADAGAMMAKLTAMSMKRAVWVMHQSVIPQLVAMNTTSFNAWLPAVALGMPSSLLGLPIYFSEKVPALGTAKDVSLCDFGTYAIGDRQGLEIGFSEHYKFINRQGTWRFFKRVDGSPWLKDKVTLADASSTVSPFVYLT